MALVRDDMFIGTSVDDVFTIKDHMLYRNGKQVPFIPHEKRRGSKGVVTREKIEVKFFTFHYSAGRMDLNNLVTYMVNLTTKADVQLCMGPAGEVVQLAPLNEKCWHMGDSSYDGYHGLNQYAAGIEVVNPGALDIVGPGKYMSWFGTKYTAADGIVEANHHLHGGAVKGWLPYRPEQLQVIRNIALAMTLRYDAKLIGHDETTPRKVDPGPLSTIPEMRDFIKQRTDPTISDPTPPSKSVPTPEPEKDPELVLEPLPELPTPKHDRNWLLFWDAFSRYLAKRWSKK